MPRRITKAIAAALTGVCCFFAGVAAGEPVPDPVMHFTNLPELPWTTFYYGVRFNSEGLLYLWEGSNIWRQDGVNVDSFTSIGAVANNMSDAGPIQFSRDESYILLGNGAGGQGPHLWPDPEPEHGGRIFSMPTEGSTIGQLIGDIDFHYDFATLPQQSTIAGADHKFFVNYGWEYYMTDPKSWVSVFDAVTGDNRTVLGPIPGASGAIAVDDDGSLYACVGYGATRGLIKRFDVEDVDEAFNNGVPLAWGQGVSINPDNYNNQSAAGMFFDARGFLFAGGDEGLTVFRPDGTSGTYNVSEIYSYLAYNPLNDQVLGNEPLIFSPTSQFSWSMKPAISCPPFPATPTATTRSTRTTPPFSPQIGKSRMGRIGLTAISMVTTQ